MSLIITHGGGEKVADRDGEENLLLCHYTLYKEHLQELQAHHMILPSSLPLVHIARITGEAQAGQDIAALRTVLFHPYHHQQGCPPPLPCTHTSNLTKAGGPRRRLTTHLIYKLLHIGWHSPALAQDHEQTLNMIF